LQLRLRTPDEAPAPFHVDEDQASFAGNAHKKAAALARLTGGISLGDDSGLCVDALGGRPGVHSARYGGPGLDDRQRLERLLHELRAVPPAQRGARFVCSLCLCAPDGSVRAALEGECRGQLLTGPRGGGGFGYDPAFVAAEHAHLDPQPTLAELPDAEKDRVSHRGKALRQLLQLLAAQPGLLAP
jgi:XTP/dITP diphosphohydrolase